MSFAVTRTPFRVSFFGGGTDYPAWYRDEGGAVLSTAIDKYCYLTCRYLPPYFGSTNHRVVWAHIETVSTVSEILHPAVRTGLQMLGFDDSRGIEILYQGDLPARSGVGSSSAFANGLILGLLALRGERISQFDLARKAIELEQDWIRDSVGSQDQMATALGGMNVIRFGPGDGIRIEPVCVSEDTRAKLLERTLMIFTGGSRLSSSVSADVIANARSRERYLRRMHEMVFEGRDLLQAGDLDGFGTLLDEAWRHKKQLSAMVSTAEVDDIYERARAAGALGGKLLGAGGAGCMLFHVPVERREDVSRALSQFIQVPFGYDREGSVVIYDAAERTAARPLGRGVALGA